MTTDTRQQLDEYDPGPVGLLVEQAIGDAQFFGGYSGDISCIRGLVIVAGTDYEGKPTLTVYDEEKLHAVYERAKDAVAEGRFDEIHDAFHELLWENDNAAEPPEFICEQQAREAIAEFNAGGDSDGR